MHGAKDKPHKNSRSRPSPMRERRLAANMTQPTFAKLLGVSASTIQAIEIGRLSLSPRLQFKMESLQANDMVKLIDEKVAGYRKELMREAGLSYNKDIV